MTVPAALREATFLRSASRDDARPERLLPPNLHPFDQRAAAALIDAAATSATFAAVLVVRVLDPDRDPAGRLHIRSDHRGVWVALGPDPLPREKRDPTTGLPGRELVADRLDHALTETIRSGLLAAIVRIDLDHWSRVCDRIGIVEADEVLCEVVARIETVTRPGDTLGHLGGDDFAVVLPGLTRPSDALQAAERLRRAIAEPFDRVIGITASFGVAVGDASDLPFELLDGAEMALWSAKSMGRDQIALHQSADRRP